MNQFAKNLAKIMKSEGISQSQLAVALDVKQQTISRYVSGEREPDFDMLVKIADYFDISIDSLLRAEENS